MCSKIACVFRGQHTCGTLMSYLSCSWCVLYIDKVQLIPKAKINFTTQQEQNQ